ncbi:MAG: DUF4276 family protein [Planctomycetes bacterium]|nr:DUF4276 family protein [Planctomycetota bacterium]
MKYILLVEGRTERDTAAAFLKRWLDPRLQRPVGVQTVPFNGYGDLVRKMATKAKMYLEGPSRNEIVAVVGLLDLYGPTFYPPNMSSAAARYAWGKAHFEKEVDLDKFRLFFAVHEFEAWLLSDPTIFPQVIRNALPNTIAQPEGVDFTEPPAKLLDRLYQQQTKRNYKKTTYGRQLFTKLDPGIATGKCPYLTAMLKEMLSLAKAAGL